MEAIQTRKEGCQHSSRPHRGARVSCPGKGPGAAQASAALPRASALLPDRCTSQTPPGPWEGASPSVQSPGLGTEGRCLLTQSTPLKSRPREQSGNSDYPSDYPWVMRWVCRVLASKLGRFQSLGGETRARTSSPQNGSHTPTSPSLCPLVCRSPWIFLVKNSTLYTICKANKKRWASGNTPAAGPVASPVCWPRWSPGHGDDGAQNRPAWPGHPILMGTSAAAVTVLRPGDSSTAWRGRADRPWAAGPTPPRQGSVQQWDKAVL